jgi:predicted ATP-dependent protease
MPAEPALPVLDVEEAEDGFLFISIVVVLSLRMMNDALMMVAD